MHLSSVIKECIPSAQNSGLCEENHSDKVLALPHQFGIHDHQDASSEGCKDESHLVPRPQTALLPSMCMCIHIIPLAPIHVHKCTYWRQKVQAVSIHGM